MEPGLAQCSTQCSSSVEIGSVLKGVAGGGGTGSHSGRWNARGSLLYMLLKTSASFAVKVGEMLSSSLSSIRAAKHQKDLAHKLRAFSASSLANSGLLVM